MMSQDIYNLSQPDFYHCTNDSFLLSQVAFDYIIQKNIIPNTVADLGAGCGAVGINFCRRLLNRCEISFVEKEVDFVHHIQFNASLLPVNTRHRIYLEDILSYANTHKSYHDLILANPPYFSHGSGRKAFDERREACRKLDQRGIIVWLACVHEMLSTSGVAFILMLKEHEEIAKSLGFNISECANLKHVSIFRVVKL